MKTCQLKTRLFPALLVCCCSVVAAFLVDDSHDETLQGALEAIQQMNGKLTEVMAENELLKQRLQDAETALASHSKTLSDLGSDVSRDLRTVSDLSKLTGLILYDDDWILAFRATAGIDQPVYDTWTHTNHHNDDPWTRYTMPCGCTTINASLPCDRHYRSRLLDSWPSNSIDQVRLALYENGVEKAHVTFTGTGSDCMNWFSHSRVIESSWTDLKSATGINYFSISGDPRGIRRFFISHIYNACPGDRGWLVVKDRKLDSCPWDTVHQEPAFLYSPSDHDLIWDGREFREADVMAVFVKFIPTAQPDEVCPN